jgi:hypothetical protein|tara:strand:- start:5702 stop:5848 length:147 start_codon:yes stop_codon:yes gene_type:complete
MISINDGLMIETGRSCFIVESMFESSLEGLFLIVVGGGGGGGGFGVFG